MRAEPGLRERPRRASGRSGSDRDEDAARPGHVRPAVRGKFLFVGDEKLYVRGVSSGTFARDDHRDGSPPLEIVESDFASMAANGLNALRTYTVPPRWLLDA